METGQFSLTRRQETKDQQRAGRRGSVPCVTSVPLW
jgi:hypothetical protein